MRLPTVHGALVMRVTPGAPSALASFRKFDVIIEVCVMIHSEQPATDTCASIFSRFTASNCLIKTALYFLCDEIATMTVLILFLVISGEWEANSECGRCGLVPGPLQTESRCKDQSGPWRRWPHRGSFCIPQGPALSDRGEANEHV